MPHYGNFLETECFEEILESEEIQHTVNMGSDTVFLSVLLVPLMKHSACGLRNHSKSPD